MNEIDQQKLGEILVKQNYVSDEALIDAQRYAAERRTTIEEYLLTAGLVTHDILGQAIAEYYNVPYADLNSNIPDRRYVLRIPEEIARKYTVTFYKEEDGKIILATDDPLNPGLIYELKQHFYETTDPWLKKEIEVSYSLKQDVVNVFLYYRKPLETRFAEILKEESGTVPDIVEEVLHDAYAYRASDVHFEPTEDDVIIRFRVDGVLQEAGRIPPDLFGNVLNRVKVWARLRIDEHFAAQDGAIRHHYNGDSADLRVSIVPTVNGEKVSIRILSRYISSYNLSDLGLSPENQEHINRVVKRPFGMMLVTGPTGSGKTTTLYAVLKTVNHPELNITTIEDPVEYRINGINQIQVNPQTDLTFAKGLRSIVRQDPDIILVGEIRDTDTAEIAVNAALTGHLLFSTFHSNDSATAIPRLLDMDIEPFLLASTLELIISQRLVRRICEHCRYSTELTEAKMKKEYPDVAKYVSGKEIRLYSGKGCDMCNGTGYQGRTAVFEMIPITKDMKQLILTNPSSQEVWELAKKEGSRSLFEDGVDKVLNGVTTIDELLRVASPSLGS
jgi:type IV pilus assembly protein PilB